MLFVIFLMACNDNEINNPYDIPHIPSKPVIIKDISPKEGGIGTRVVVTGSNFGNNKERVKLLFNEKEAHILKIQDNAIYASVPKQPGELSKIKVIISKNEIPDSAFNGTEAVLEDTLFRYHLKAAVTTVAGIAGISKFNNGTALEGTFSRPAKIAVNSTGNILIVSDDWADAVRLVSIEDNKLTTLISGLEQPWSISFTKDFSRFFVLERNATARPVMYFEFDKSNDWLSSQVFYDQKDASDNYLIGNFNVSTLTVDDEYVYLLRQRDALFFRVSLRTGQMELIGEKLNLGNWPHIAYNYTDGYIYACTEDLGQIFRFNPRHTPLGRDKPFITYTDVTHIAGSGAGSALEGNGIHARFGNLEEIAADREGNVYFTDYKNHVIWKMDKEFNCEVLAGVPGTKGYKDGKPEEALFNSPYGLCVTPDGIVYVADTYNYVVRCISIQ